MRLFRTVLYICCGFCIGIIGSPAISGDMAAVGYAIQIVGIPAAICTVLLYLIRERQE